MANAQVLHVPMKLGPELMAVIGTDRVNAKGKSINHVIDEIKGSDGEHGPLVPH